MFSNPVCIIIYYMYNSAKIIYNNRFYKILDANHLQIIIHPVIFLVEGEVHQFEAVGDLKHGVVGDGAAALAVEAGGVQIDLDLGHHIDVGGAGKLAA